MKLNSIRWAGALGLYCVALARAPVTHAEDKMTLQSLIDRQLILDQITRYDYNFGNRRGAYEDSWGQDYERVDQFQQASERGLESLVSCYAS